MKRKHDFLCIFAVVAFMLVFHHVLLCGQTSGVKPGIRFIRIAKTSDVLYTNDSTYFLMDRSPLEKFPDYKKLYEKYKDKMVEHVDGFFYGMAIRPDKTTSYSAIWSLNDSLLYLSDIDFFLLVDKAVIHAHTTHTNKMSDFFFDVVEKPSMGNYIYSKYGDKYFSMGFQAGEGLYTQDDSGIFSKTVTDTLQTPIPTSFEYSALKVDSPYFYYPTDRLPEGISDIRIVTRERKNLNQLFFCSIKKRFNGLAFIRDNSPLNDIEQYPAFYTNELMQFKNKQQRGLLPGSK